MVGEGIFFGNVGFGIDVGVGFEGFVIVGEVMGCWCGIFIGGGSLGDFVGRCGRGEFGGG